MPPKDKDTKPAPPKPFFASFFDISDMHPFDAAVFIVIVLSVLAALFGALLNLDFRTFTFFGYDLRGVGRGILDFLKGLRIFAYILCAAGFILAAHFSMKTGEIYNAYKAKFFPQGEPEVADGPVEEVNPMRDRWEKIIEHVNSDVESNWRLAIIEADIMLDELLDKLNMPGDTIGDKLKAVEKGDFLTLDHAWEAHKARNQIAHQGSGFQFNQRQAKHIVSLYEAVFKEFYFI
jgi:hypothetical protein